MKRPTMLVWSAWFIATAAGAQEAIAPYSAQRVVERVQTLADGTHITQNPAKDERISRFRGPYQKRASIHVRYGSRKNYIHQHS